jgi:hypothetical protein
MNKRKTAFISAVLAAILALTCWLFTNHYFFPSPPPTSPAVNSLFSHSFLVGVNYPWVSYGSDFGDSYWGHVGVSTAKTTQIVEQDFAQLQADNVTIVRWFLWADGHGGIHFNQDGSVAGLDSDFFVDMDAALEIARRHNIRIMFVLIDFKFFEGIPYGTDGHNWGGHDVLVNSKKARASFLEKAVRPLIERYAVNENIAAWEVVNEPEWELGTSIRWGRKEFSPRQMQSFIASVVNTIHRYSKQPVTVGSLTPSLLSLWTGVGLDFYETHSYPYTELFEPVALSNLLQRLGKPCLLGEYPTTNGSRKPQEYLQQAYSQGYAGAFAWSMRASDKYSRYSAARHQIKKWHKAH